MIVELCCAFRLESLDGALNEREASKVEIDSLKEQNEQLLKQYEREKGFHKEYQQVDTSHRTCSCHPCESL